MTAQIPDKYRYKGRNYSIIAMTNPLDFRPEEYGFHPTAPHTACWRGYFCQYNITDEELHLDRLWIYCHDQYYPEFEGVSPVEDNRESGMMVYKDLHHVIDYDGKIVVGSGFIDQYYIHAGFQRAWAYKNVYELVFEQGKVINKVNHSKYVEGLREQIKAGHRYPEEVYHDITGLFDDGYTLDAKVKAWWI